MVAFSERGRRALPVIIAVTPAALTLLWIPLGFAGGWPIVPLLLIEYVGLAIVATALHGRLAGDRPPPEGLTGFYLTMSAGGAIGGAFVGILAPLVFPGIWEYPILIAAAAIVLAWTRPTPPSTAAIDAPSPASSMAGRGGSCPISSSRSASSPSMRVDGSPALDAAARWLWSGRWSSSWAGRRACSRRRRSSS